MTADKSGLLSGIKIAIAILTACMVGGTAIAQSFSRPADLAFNREHLDFVLKQIKISERHAAGELLPDILPNISVPWGLRTVDGRYNNLFPGREGFGQADREFNQDAERDFREASNLTMDPDNGGPQMVGDKTSYGLNTNVEDSTPRLISHLIVNQSTENPAAVHAAAEEEGVNVGPDIAGTDQFFIPNVATDEGLSAPFNTFLTFFGQFFDHGLDLVNKGGSGNVFMRVPADDPLFDDTNADMNFMIMPRASRDAGLDGIIDTMDDVSFPINATTPHVDQQQTYASHASSQIILRHYEMGMGGGGALSVAHIGDWMDGDLPGYNHPAPAGSNRVLVVMAHAEDNGSTADTTDFTSVTYGGQALTQVVEQLQNQSSSFSATSEIWVLDEAGIQAASGSTLVVTTSGAAEGRRISSAFYAGVDQLDPTGPTGTDGQNANDAQTLSVILSGGELDAGDMVVANNTVRNDQSGDTSWTWQNGFSQTGSSSPTGEPYLTYSDAQILADGTAETATVDILNNGVGALSVMVLNHAEPCGDGDLDSGEQCDDGNLADGDCCSATCQFETGSCDDSLFCTTGETCSAGLCGGGSAVTGDDGVPCTDDSCDEAGDVIVNAVNDANCDDGAFCNGAETCHAATGCQAGSAPIISDGVSCTDDSCDEVGDVVVNTADDLNCDDGDACTADACDAVSGCSNTPIPECSVDVPAVSRRGESLIAALLLAAAFLAFRRRSPGLT